MPRKKQNVGLEHGGDYGTVQSTADSMNPVSYTHLTLPTIYSV